MDAEFIVQKQYPSVIQANIESYGLTWVGKSAAIAEANSRCDKLLKPVPELCVGIDHDATKDPINATNVAGENLFIEGDNLDALKLLQDSHQGSVHAIYIDPPYNTGNGFVYEDNFREGRREYNRGAGRTGDLGANEADGRYHSRWLSMMYPRIQLARNLLRDDGVIFVSIDDNEIDKLRLLMSEIFGESNFVAQIVIQSNPRGRQSEKHFATVHEYLLVFAKNTERCKISGAALTEDQLSEFNKVEPDGRRYRLLGLRQRGSASLREDRPGMYYPIFVDPKTARVSLTPSEIFTEQVLPKKSTGQPGRWMWGPERSARLIELLEAKLIRSRNEWDIFVRDYVDDSKGKIRTRKLKTIWDDKELNYQHGKSELKDLFGEALLDYPKPLALLRKIIGLIQEPDALFLDFFAGSGTLGHAVLNANQEDGQRRRFILVQIAEETGNKQFPTITDICSERIRRVILKNQPFDPSVGYRYLRVATAP